MPDYVVSAVIRMSGQRVELITVDAPEKHAACLKAVRLMDKDWKKKIDLMSLDARPAT